MCEVPPFLTNVCELAPPELEIPAFFVVQPIEVEYFEENIDAERVNGCVEYIVPWSLRRWRWGREELHDRIHE